MNMMIFLRLAFFIACILLLFLAVEIDLAKVVFNEYDLKDVVVAIAQKYMVVA